MCFQVVPGRDIRAKVPGKGANVRLKSVRKVETKVSRCIEVDSADRLFAVGGDDGQSILSHNSVAQRNVFLGCAMRPDNWIFTGIDLKRVELSGLRAYKDVVAGIATELEDAVTILRWAQEVMMSRYTQMEELGINNFLDLPGGGKALMVMVDEAGELLSPSGVKALGESTPIPMADGSWKTMGELEVGDIILDHETKPTGVEMKYEPVEQTKYSMSISKDSTGEKEDVLAGSEHNWVVIYQHPDGSLSEETIVSTEELFKFKSEQDGLPESQRTTVKFRKYE